MPTFKELVELELIAKPPVRERKQGLYDALLGRPEPLYYDALEHPEKYREEDVQLFEEMLRGKKTLTDEEQDQLNRAMLDFVAAPRPPAPKQKIKVVEEKKDAPVEETAVAALIEGELPPYWWV